MKSKSKKNTQPIDWENTYQVCQLLQHEIQEAVRAGKKISQLAEGIDLTARTISRIGYGDTKDPRANTCLILLRKFGYKVKIHQ